MKWTLRVFDGQLREERDVEIYADDEGEARAQAATRGFEVISIRGGNRGTDEARDLFEPLSLARAARFVAKVFVILAILTLIIGVVAFFILLRDGAAAFWAIYSTLISAFLFYAASVAFRIWTAILLRL